MKCPRCGEMDSKVVDSRVSKEGSGIRRRREWVCGHRFTTLEQLVPAELVVIKRDESRQEFDPSKIREGIEKACWKRPVGEDAIDLVMQAVTTEIDGRGEREIHSDLIGEIVMEKMRAVDQVAYVRFASVYRQFEDAEAFISEIRKMGRRRRSRAGAKEAL